MPEQRRASGRLTIAGFVSRIPKMRTAAASPSCSVAFTLLRDLSGLMSCSIAQRKMKNCCGSSARWRRISWPPYQSTAVAATTPRYSETGPAMAPILRCFTKARK
jgi:hypothetical protein